ncbi:hypothetical protein LUZ60_016092 [Juncus effusus]|nr:hypothetical protein LUZ60_016092 [Juncus effusus]
MGKERQWSRSISKGEKGISNIGCMGGMLHYFDFHRLLFTGTGHNIGRTTSISRTSLSRTNGLEAPRNSLEKEDAKVSSSSAIEDEFFDIPVGIQLAPSFDSLPIKIKKKHNKKLSILEDEEEKRIPQTPETPRTPSLVARLMGIDGLPDPAPSPPVTARQRALTRVTKESSMRDQSKKNDKERNYDKQKEYKREVRQPLQSINCNIRNRDLGSRSLPDSPRVSSARSWEVEHRLSLQINRENSNSNHFHPSVGGDYSLPPSPTHYTMKSRRRYQDENRSPRRQEYAKEIVKQMKESVSNRRANGCEDNIAKTKRTTTREVQKKSVIYENVKKAVETKAVPINVPFKISELQSKTKLVDQIPNLQTLAKPPRVKPSRPPPPPPIQEGQMGKCNKGSNERFTARFKKPSPSLSPPLTATNGEKQQFSVTMEKIESTPKLVRSPQLKSDESTSYSMQMKVGATRPPPDQDPEYKYVQSILHRGGFMSHTCQPVRFYSTSLPVDPIVFHQLELDLPVEDWRYRSNPLRYRWNRKLLFHLVQEFLEDLSQDHPSTMKCDIYHDKHRTARRKYPDTGLQLFKKLWTQIQIIPSSNCQYLGDIDALVASDLATKYTRELTRHPAVAEESSDVAVQVEQEILDELIGETAASLSLAVFPRQRVMTSADVRVS